MTFGGGTVIFPLGLGRGGPEARGEHRGAHPDAHRRRLLGEVDGVGRAGLLALAAEDAVLDVEHGLLGDGRPERDVDGAPGAQMPSNACGTSTGQAYSHWRQPMHRPSST